MGEPSFETPDVIRAAHQEALRKGATHYAPQGGLPELRETIEKVELLDHDLDFGPDNVLITHGGTAGLASLILGTVSHGDLVAIEDPTYSLYADLVALAGGSTATYRRNAAGELDARSLMSACSGARLLILCQPSNPTGSVFSSRDWDLISEVARRNEVLVLSDEAYEGLVYDGVQYTSLLERTELRDRLVVCRTFSKKFAMTGWRLGYLIAAQELLSPAALVHRTYNGAVNTAVQWAGIAALSQAQDAAEHMRSEFAVRRVVMGEEISKLDCLEAVVPEGAFYYWCQYSSDGPSSVQMATAARESGVAVRPGLEYGASGEHAIRLSFSASAEEIREGVSRLREVLNRHG